MLRRNRMIREKVSTYADSAKEGLNTFEAGMRFYCENGLTGMGEWMIRVHERESACDQICRDIELDLFEKSLLPETREDLMNLLEYLDKIVNCAESAMRKICVQHVQLPNGFCKPLEEIVRMSVKAGSLAMDMAIETLEKSHNIREFDREIDSLESKVDAIEQQAISDLFDTDLELAEKLMIREIIETMANISDIAEEVSGRLMIFSAKRRG